MMTRRQLGRALAMAAAGSMSSTIAGAARAGILSRRVEPAEVLPMYAIDPAHRAGVEEVIRHPSFHHRSRAETFPCTPQIYLGLLNEPALTLALWHDLSTTPARLASTGPGQYFGTDGNGTTATWSYVHRSPTLHVLLCTMHYDSPRRAAHLEGRLVLIVRTNYFKEATGDPWIRHDIEAFVKIDTPGWRTVAKTLRPLIEKLLDEQIQEAGWFVSLMGRLVEAHPDWADQVAATTPAPLDPRAREQFRALIARHRRPDASPGRPALADAGYANATR